jgi:hypothetical protein
VTFPARPLREPYKTLDWLTALDEGFLHDIRYAIYFVGFVAFYELRHRGEGTVATVAVGIPLVILSIVLFVPRWSPYVLRRLIVALESDAKLDVSAAHIRLAPGEIASILRRDLGLRAATRLADHLCKLSRPRLYKLLQM